MQPLISRPLLCGNCVKFKDARKRLSNLRTRARRYRIERPSNWEWSVRDLLAQIDEVRRYITELRERAPSIAVRETFDAVLEIDKLADVYDQIEGEKAQLEEAAEFILLNQ